MSFSGKTAVVTGAAGGMGMAISEALLAEGCNVALLDMKAPQADFAGLPGKAMVQKCDVSQDDQVAAAITAAHSKTGRLDYLVNAAAVLWFGRDRSLVDIDLDTWNQALSINLTSLVLTCRHAVPLMKRSGGGAMVHVASTQALRGDDQPQDSYQAAKAAILSLSKSLAIQFAADGIRSNCLVPGPTESPMQDRWKSNPEAKQRTAAAVPLGRVGTPQDMANAVLFLLSDKAAFITGTDLIVDGGLMARP